MSELQNDPIDNIKRRKFLTYSLRTLAGVWAAALFYPIVKYLAPHNKEVAVEVSEVNLGVKELVPGGSESFAFGAKPAILFKTKDGELKAVSAVCTHLGCTVVHKDDLSKSPIPSGYSGPGFFCNCHLGVYDENGKNVGGPPPAPLPPFKVTVAENGDVTVSKS
ncbi:MAG: Rieske (2Fe-2S) protein [Bacteroidetes bacterium]|nr:Rieske (2Fe-2S) protein [Bacteroidota bacterium]